MKAKLVRITGESKQLSLVFSWGYLFFGPLYYLFYRRFLRFILLTILYVFCFWKQCGSLLVDLFIKWGASPEYVNFLKIPGENYWITFGVIVGVHFVTCFIAPKVIVKGLLHKRGYVPYSEMDAQLLVKHSLAKVGTIPYLANFKAVNGVQGKIKIENTEDLNKKLDELAQLLKEGMITKDEYNTKRAEALMNVENKKK